MTNGSGRSSLQINLNVIVGVYCLATFSGGRSHPPLAPMSLNDPRRNHFAPSNLSFTGTTI